MDLFRTLFAELVALQTWVHQKLGREFTGAVDGGETGHVAVLLVLAAAFGAVHAVGPGHGKSVVFAYFVARQAAFRDGIAAGAKVILVHVGSAILLVLAAVYVLDVAFGLRPADFPAVRLISYAGIALVGIWLTVRALRSLRGPSPARVTASGPALPGRVLPYVVGLAPCPLTTIIMVAAVGTGATALGLLVSVFMAAGMVVTLAVFALAAIALRRVLLGAMAAHPVAFDRAVRSVEIAGALVVAALGVLLFVLELQAPGVVA